MSIDISAQSQAVIRLMQEMALHPTLFTPQNTMYALLL